MRSKTIKEVVPSCCCCIGRDGSYSVWDFVFWCRIRSHEAAVKRYSEALCEYHAVEVAAELLSEDGA